MGVFRQITDDGFPGAKSLDFIGQRIVYAEPFGRYWGWSSLVDGSSWNSLDQAQAETSPDRIQGLIVSHNEVLIFGERTIEPWAHAPTDTAVFQLQTGSVIECGCASGKTIQRLDNSVFFLTNNGQIARLNGYTPLVVSTAAMEASIRDLNWSRAFAFTWEDAGHVVYYITFPDGYTWGLDVRQNKWHRRESFGLDRWRINALAKSNGKWIAGDYSSGRVYEVEWGNVYEACEIMPRKFRSGVLHNASNRVRVDGFRIVAATGQPPIMPAQIGADWPESALLVTGGGSAPFAASDATYPPSFTALSPGTGADLSTAVCAFASDGESEAWVAIGQGSLRYSIDGMASWITASTPWPTANVERLVYGHEGWLIQSTHYTDDGLMARASLVPTDMAVFSFVNAARGSIGSSTLVSTSNVHYTAGKYYVDGAGAWSGNLWASAELDANPWPNVTIQTASIPPGTSAVRYFFDVVEIEDSLYACCYFASGGAYVGNPQGYQLRRSVDGGDTWPEVLIDGPADGTSPLQICIGNGVILVYCRGAEWVYTSLDGFSVKHATGIATNAAADGADETFGRQIVYSSGYFYIISGNYTLDLTKANKCVATADGITFSSPAALPLTGARAIATDRNPDEDPIIYEACAPMESGVFQLRYANDGAENYSNWRDFEAPTTGRFLQPLVARRLGMARHRVWEVMDTSNRPQDVLAAEIIAQ